MIFPLDASHIEAQWAALAKTPAFTDFFLPHVIGSVETQTGLAWALNEQFMTCPLEEVPSLRFTLGELTGLRNDADARMKKALKNIRP